MHMPCVKTHVLSVNWQTHLRTRVIFYVRRIGLYLYKYRIYGTISIYFERSSFCLSTDINFISLDIQTLIVDKCRQNSYITILKHPLIYQNNHSQVLVIISVKITIMKKFKNFFWFCIANDMFNHSSEVILMYRLKRVHGNFPYCHTSMYIKWVG